MKKIDADLLERRIMTTYFDGETKARILEIIDSLVKDPELRESEDERIRKDIIGGLMWQRDNLKSEGPHDNNLILPGFCFTVGKHLTYLEKQKEQNLIMANSPQLKEQKPEEKPINWTELTWKDIDKLEGIINNVHYEFRNGIGQESFGKEVLEKFREYKGDEYLDEKEQKPLSTEETELNALAFLSQMGYTCIPPKKEHQNNSDAPKNALGGALNSPLDKDKNLDDIAQDYVEAVKEYNPEPTWNLMQTAVCYGYHYREGEEQKPAEWSEEDERNIRNLESILYYDKKLPEETCVELGDFLKSFRPSWKPSEVQKDSLERAIYILREAGHFVEVDCLEPLLEHLKKLKGGVAPMKDIDE